MKKYDNYKSTKIVWYPEIPKHWNYCKVKHLANTFAGGTPSTVVNSYWDGGEIPWLPSGKLQNCEIVSAEKFITEDGLNNSSTKWIKPNTVLIALTGATCANIGYLKFTACANQSVVAIDETTNKANSRFLYYMFLSMRSQILTHQTGGAQAGINDGDVKNLYLLQPSLSEQTKIASFLDYKTNLIDTTIEKKKRLIELLKEKRQAVINEAVTKGLNPNAPMKDSGVEWLGEIPEHWEVKRLRHIGNCQNGVSEGGEYFGSGFPFVSYGDVYKNEILPSIVQGLAKSTEEDKIRFSVEKGDVFFTRTSETIEEIGISSTCLQTIENAVFAGFLIKFRPFENVLDPNFSKYYFRSFIPRYYFVKEMNLVTRASLSQDLLKGLPVILPSLEEQLEIAKSLDKNSSIIDKSISKIKFAIEKLQTYRQSLISEAVTGKIDVRDWEKAKN
jgi:type I restriction enzyme, S subunit